MSTIEVFEPALCCSTGVCGTDVPQELVNFSADLDWLRSQGGDIARFNLASEPTAFAGRPAVVQFLQLSGSEGLPLVLVDGAVAMTGRYPGRDQLARWAALAPVPAGRTELGLTQDAGGCCGGSGCC
ncbi:arsenite efflux transporter metallochaperone ArsD [Georgenia yuyongxinii]|uniref:Arsenite efflux transporter metallochaperone ArsD n=1 Tax=Georgenia yuyongxinii TaxID=2589797 RepID=A0A552WSV3_9MICO|nr:arsenite efflux transporter metallochaperone ArsD [Georgenia yuyongxinii]TRW45755.1 arsenite efflux transporter metallochaperone ArsD [Georgenia yuyongxinii]